MSHSQRIMRTLAAFVLTVLVAGCVPSPAPGASGSGVALPTREPIEGAPEALGPDEALRRDAEAYAEQFDVTVEEATQRLQFQDGIGELNGALQANEADTFGGLWIEHEPDYRVVVLFTRNGKRTIRPYLAAKPYAHLVEVRQARYSLAELETIYAQATRELAKLDFGVNVTVADQGNDRLVVLSFDGTNLGFVRVITANLNQPMDVATFKDYIVVADTGNDEIKVLDTAGALLFTYTAPGDGYTGPFQWPSGVAMDAVGTIIVADTGNGRVVTLPFVLSPYKVWLPLVLRRWRKEV